ncbi:MAG: hypothetical protein JOY87_02580 [Candidatus Eremiobacteraeota bacterium]|nr:hypothetical protein [Candidatus Eremiobacteraeota bacterium]
MKSDTDPRVRSGIVLLGLGRWNPNELGAAALARRVGITVRENGVRVSPHAYNNDEDIDTVLDLVAAEQQA